VIRGRPPARSRPPPGAFPRRSQRAVTFWSAGGQPDDACPRYYS